jgi:NADP-dependent 3-hydroxy acid dehydrogenase YdfG
MLELNVIGLMAATQTALAGMRARHDGQIVNISSIAGRIASPTRAGDSASKFAVIAFSEALRREIYKDHIRVTVPEPGIVDTELREHRGY